MYFSIKPRASTPAILLPTQWSSLTFLPSTQHYKTPAPFLQTEES